MPLISTRTFTADDQVRFASWSGDVNPMHVDPAAARRTQAGALAVHGVHALLWALDTLQGDRPICKVTALFEKFMTVDQPVELHATDGDKTAKLELRSPAGRTVGIRVTYGEPLTAEAKPSLAPSPLPTHPDELSFDETRAGAGAFLMTDAALLESFPRLTARCGDAGVRGLMALSSLVGMICPGLHSIFSSLSAEFVAFSPGDQQALTWRTTANHDAFSLIEMEAHAPGLRAIVEAFSRPPPVEQPTLEALRKHVPPEAYSGVNALIIGGSRGLGEITAKLLAAGGARVAITYAAGQAEAQRLQNEFAAQGAQLIIRAFEAGQPAAPQLQGVPFRPTHIFYFATSKISRQKAKLYNTDLFSEFHQIYASSFYDICQFYSGAAPLQMFYPSSVFVQERPRDLAEYAMAKAAGEILCDEIDRFMPGIRVLRRRLPRLATDQTASLTAVENISSLDVMREIVDTLCLSSTSH